MTHLMRMVQTFLLASAFLAVTGCTSSGDGSVRFEQEPFAEIIAAGVPMFGICLGHQILALASGAKTEKMKFGHHGANHPVQDLATQKVMITSQNHGFGVSPDAIKASDKVEITHVNLNDDTIEGIKVKDKKAFSVQYHPESSPRPHDSRYLFDDFVNLIQSTKGVEAVMV